jgi:GAF domain-containing protein
MEKMGGKVLVGDLPRSYLGVPLVAGGESIGVISLQSIDHEDAFSESDLRLLEYSGSNVSVALENARLYQETQRHGDQMATIADVGRELASFLD